MPQFDCFFRLAVHTRTGLIAGLVLMLGACAGSPKEADIAAGGGEEAVQGYGPNNTPDPYQNFNIKVFKINRAVDRAVLDPVVDGYRYVVPRFVRKRLSNAFDNLNEPLNLVHNLLQGNPDRAGKNLGRFFINSTFGLAGIFDVAGKGGIEQADEDFGQTLAVWGVPSGPFLMLPLLGPSTVRDGLGQGLDGAANPVNYVIGGNFGVELFDATIAQPAIAFGNAIQTRANFDDAADQLFSLDPEEGYRLAREGYLGQRCFAIENNRLGACQDDFFEDDFDDFSGSLPGADRPIASATVSMTAAPPPR